MNRQPVLEGERLLLRPLEEADRDALYAVATDPLLWEQHPMHDRWQERVFRPLFEAFRSGAEAQPVSGLTRDPHHASPPR